MNNQEQNDLPSSPSCPVRPKAGELWKPRRDIKQILRNYYSGNDVEVDPNEYCKLDPKERRTAIKLIKGSDHILVINVLKCDWDVHAVWGDVDAFSHHVKVLHKDKVGWLIGCSGTSWPAHFERSENSLEER